MPYAVNFSAPKRNYKRPAVKRTESVANCETGKFISEAIVEKLPVKTEGPHMWNGIMTFALNFIGAIERLRLFSSHFESFPRRKRRARYSARLSH